MNADERQFIINVKLALKNYTVKNYPIHESYSLTDYTKAAVLIPIIYCRNEWHIIFTERSHELRTHKGQISFPGGKVDETDNDICEAAKREAWEEVGIEPEDVEIIGRISTYQTPSGYEINPVVGIVEHFIENLSEDEVNFVLAVPINHLMDYTNMEIILWERSGLKYPLPFFYYDGHKIWGATGLILKDFLDHIKSYIKYCS